MRKVCATRGTRVRYFGISNRKMSDVLRLGATEVFSHRFRKLGFGVPSFF